MAAAPELFLLLFALISSVHAEELLVILEEKGYYFFELAKNANSCLISRYVNEKRMVLWNTSDLSSESSSVPEDLKKRLSVGYRDNSSVYMIHSLTHSDSGPYQKQCWTEGKMTYDQNITFIICGSVEEETFISTSTEATVELPCKGAATNLDVQWLKHEIRHQQEIWTRVFGNNETTVTERYQMVTNTSALCVPNLTPTVYTCLVMNQQQCVSSHPVYLEYQQKQYIMVQSVDEAAVMPCTGFTDEQPPYWKKGDMFMSYEYEVYNYTVSSVEQEVDQNYSLVFPSLMLNHSGMYFCESPNSKQNYLLLVCPKTDPPAVQFFTEGEIVTVRCNDWDKGVAYSWFIRLDQTEGEVMGVTSNMSLGRIRTYHNGSLIISNVSLEDTGEYSCTVHDKDFQCVSTAKTVLKHRKLFGFQATIYILRCSVLSALLVMLCGVVVAVNLRTRRGQL